VARESALWQRMRDGCTLLRKMGHKIDATRIENEIGVGFPDVDVCIDGRPAQIELKSEDRPARANTVIRPKVRDSQRDWHRDRCRAGCRYNWVLLQVGEAAHASLYLVPGCYYEKITATEDDLLLLSLCQPKDTMVEVLLTVKRGW